MNGVQNRKAHAADKPFPGCLGRTVNLFDLNSGIAGNRLLMDKPYRDGSSLSRSRSDVARTWSPPFGDQIEDKVIVSDSRETLSRKVNGTPMKMLIDQEMSKEGESKHNPTNVVARLMGLDALPQPRSDSASQRKHAKGHSRRSLSHSAVPFGSWQQEDGLSDKGMPCEIYQSPEQNEYKDVYEIWQQSEKKNPVRDESPQKGRHHEKINEKKMALVRQKFVEAKRLATDEKLRQSREFQDALEVLSSNKDLFLKFLQEPNSLFSQHIYDLRSIPPPPETKRITVLRPSKMVDGDKFIGLEKKTDKPLKKTAQLGQAVVWDKVDSGFLPTSANQKVDEYAVQPTRIVVLKPSPGKPHDIKAVVSSPSLSPRILPCGNFYSEAEDDEALESREVAKEITRKMRENFMSHKGDETLISSVFSNGYTGDESSFNKSENEYVVENLSDSEVMSPSPRHSWDYINRFGSPYSSSFSRVSCSPESSVCREAKKRLSERWALMASNGRSQEQRHARKSSSTLGEMLALSDTKKSIRIDDTDGTGQQEPKELVSCLTNKLDEEESLVDSPKNLLRSKSLPVTSTVNDTKQSIEVSVPEAGKTITPKELTKAKSMKSLRGKVSSLFFSRNKKSSKDKSSTSQCKDESQSASSGTPGSPLHLLGADSDATSQCTNDGLSPGQHGSSCKISPDLTSMGQNQGIATCEAGFSVSNPLMHGDMGESQDQPSPISVLEPPFEDDRSLEASGCTKSDHRGKELAIKSNLIDKSPPIGSIARTLSWDDSCAETATPYSAKPLGSPSIEEEQNWLSLVQSLLSEAGLDNEVQSETYFSIWLSLENPLDPSLRDKFANLYDKDFLPEAKRRQRRSIRKLVFDCVNAALLEISGYGSDKYLLRRQGDGADSRVLEGASAMLVDRVWAKMQEWIFTEGSGMLGEGGDSNSLVVERLVRKEVVGKGWVELLRLEMDNVGKEIEGKLLEELVEEAVVDLTGRV